MTKTLLKGELSAMMTPNAVDTHLNEAARSLGFVHIAIANNDVGEALSFLAEVCYDIAAVCEALSSPSKETLQ